jgi:hypothetical protein
MLQKIERARREAALLTKRAHASTDMHLRDEWLRAAATWEEIARQYEILQRVCGPDHSE